MSDNNKWVNTYNHLLEEVQVFLDKTEDTLEKTSLDDVVETVKNEIEEVSEASKEELHLIGEYIKRDIHSASESFKQTKKDFKEWLPFEVELTESLLWDRIMEVADPTTIELEELKVANTELRTGEITRPVQLICTSCGEVIDFPKTAEIPACSNCQGTHFIRKPLTETGADFGSTFKEEINSISEKLKMERDDLKLQMHLAGMEAKDLWSESEEKWQTFKHQLGKVSDKAFDITENEFSDTADDILAIYKKIKKHLS